METIKNLQEFRNKAKELPLKKSNEYYYHQETPEADCIVSYDGYEILKMRDKKYLLLIGRSDFIGTLAEMEILLWDWAKFEIGVSPEDIEEDLHERSRQLMDSLDKKYSRKNKMSLEEYYAEYIEKNSDEDSKKIKYLLDEFDEI